MPFSISSYLPVLDKSSRLRTLWLSSPFAAARAAAATSLAFASSIKSLFAKRAAWSVLNASLRASLESLARWRDAKDALLAISEAEDSVSDILNLIVDEKKTSELI
jgi:hypothetical protein